MPTKPRKSTASPKRPTARRIPSRGSAIDAPPPHDAIASRAYELFLRRGGTHGQDQTDWLEAERELRERHGSRESPEYAS